MSEKKALKVGLQRNKSVILHRKNSEHSIDGLVCRGYMACVYGEMFYRNMVAVSNTIS